MGGSAVLGTLADLTRADMLIHVGFHVGPPNALGEKSIGFCSSKVASDGATMRFIQQQLAASLGDNQLPKFRRRTTIQ